MWFNTTLCNVRILFFVATVFLVFDLSGETVRIAADRYVTTSCFTTKTYTCIHCIKHVTHLYKQVQFYIMFCRVSSTELIDLCCIIYTCSLVKWCTECAICKRVTCNTAVANRQYRFSATCNCVTTPLTLPAKLVPV